MQSDPASIRGDNVNSHPLSDSPAAGISRNDAGTRRARGPRTVRHPLALPGTEEARPSVLQTFAADVRAALDAARSEDVHDTPASAAERHRLATSNVFGLPLIAKWIIKLSPYCALLATVFILRHSVGIMMFGVYSMCLHNLHTIFRSQVALSGDRRKRTCLASAAASLLSAFTLLWSCHRQRLWLNLVLVNLPPQTVMDVIFTVTMADVVVRHLTFAVKFIALAICSASNRSRLRRRSQMLAFIDNVFLFWRTQLGTPCWFGYLNGASAEGFWMSSCAGAFAMLKVSATCERGVQMVASGLALKQGSHAGKSLSDAELGQASSQCTICHEDIRNPLQLSCSHVFCDECISEWLERERTCPNCRTVVQPLGISSPDETALLPLCF